MNNIIIGKRISVGAAITSLAGIGAHFYPQHGAAFIALAVPLTFGLQLFIVNKYGVTTKP